MVMISSSAGPSITSTGFSIGATSSLSQPRRKKEIIEREKTVFKVTFTVKPLVTDGLWKKGSSDQISNDWEMVIALR